MWIVKLALRRPYTFIVAAICILVAGFASFLQTPKDIFPEIKIPVVSLIWTYNGLSAEEFEKQITVFSEFSLSAAVNDIERIESQTLDGVAVIKLYFHPGADISLGLAQATAVSQSILSRMPPGVRPPTILRYAADSVPIIQISLSSDKLSESELYTYGIFRIQPVFDVFANVQGRDLGGVPAASVMTGREGPQVAVVDSAEDIRLQKVQLGRDLGKTVEIRAGLKEGARIVTNPTDTLADGMKVMVAGAANSKPAISLVAKR
jgi:multidrug efflux pump subunit AcrB